MGEVIPFPSRARPRPVQLEPLRQAYLNWLIEAVRRVDCPAPDPREFNDWLDQILGKEKK